MIATRPLRVAALGVALALGGCGAERTPPAAAAPHVYHALSEPEIRAHMRVLTDELVTMTALTVPTTEVEETRRAAVIDALGRIERRALKVGGGGRLSNYSLVNDYMDGFLGDVELAREFAARDPANLVPANRLVQSCRSCHASL